VITIFQQKRVVLGVPTRPLQGGGFDQVGVSLRYLQGGFMEVKRPPKAQNARVIFLQSARVQHAHQGGMQRFLLKADAQFLERS